MLPKIFSRKISTKRGRIAAARVQTPPLSPVSEHSAYSIPASDAPRPVPPPQHYHHDDDEFRDFERDDLHEPHSRLYETFTASSDDGRRATPVPLVVRQELERDIDGHEHAHIHERTPSDDYVDDDYVDDLGFINSQPEHVAQNEPILIAPSSERSHSSRSSGRGQRVTFIGSLRERDHESPILPRRNGSSMRSFSSAGDRLRPPSSERSRHMHTYPRREPAELLYAPREPEPLHRRRASVPRDRRYELQLPYMIFVDFGDGLEIGNEVDGFMPYTEYLATAHLRMPKENVYFIIPGSTPVIFNDEDGQELYRVEAQKYNTPTLRRRRYIIQDEYGNELYRIGNFRDRDYNGPLAPSPSSNASGYGSRSPHSKPPRVMYLNSNNGSVSSRSKYSRSASSRYSASDEERTESSDSSVPDILVMDENGHQIFDSSRERDNFDRPNYVFVDEHGRPVDKETYYPREFRSGSSSGSSEESYEHLSR